MDIKLVVMDMDGTLLNTQGKITEKTMRSLLEAQKQGVRLALASGRSYKTLTSFGQQLQMPEYDGYFICVNGTSIVKTSTMEHEIIGQLYENDLKTIFEFAKPYEIETMAVMDETIYDYIPRSLMEIKRQYRIENNIAEDVPWTAGTFKLIVDQRKGYTGIHYIDSYEEIPNSVNKVCIAHLPEKLLDFYQDATKSLGDRYNFARTSHQWIEITPIDISKGKTILKLAKQLGIDQKEIMVFGDGENDLPMFEVAGCAVAMGNAMDTVKEKAQLITTDNDHDGIAEIIEKYVLKA